MQISMPFVRASRRHGHHRNARNVSISLLDDPNGVSASVLLLSGAVFACGLIFGGGEGSFGDVVAQLLALPLIVLAALQWSTARLRASDWLALAVIVGIAVLACIELMPLSLPAWAALPGRAELLAQMQAAKVVPAWTSISLNPLGTERALLWTLPAIAMFLAVRWMSPRQQKVLVLALFVGGVLMTIMDVVFRTANDNGDVTAASLLAKAYQDDAGIQTATRAPISDTAMTGLFSNHNHFGTFLAMTIPLMVAMGLGLWLERKRGKGRGAAAAMTLLALGAVSLLAAAFETHSRAALLLGSLALVGSGALLADLGLPRRTLWSIAGASVLMVVIAGITAGATGLDRLGNGIDNDLRWQIHGTTLDAAHHFGTMGAGLGTFVEAYQAVPPQEGMLPAFVNRAHGDYHELWLETGIPGVILIVAFIVWFGWSSLRAWLLTPADAADADPRHGRERLFARAASVSIGLLLIHSYVEYPLHKTAILVVFGLCCGLLARGPEKARATEAPATVASARA